MSLCDIQIKIITIFTTEDKSNEIIIIIIIIYWRHWISGRAGKAHHASSAWWGFTSARDQQKLYAFIRRSQRSRFVPPNLPSFAELCRTADERLFNQILSNETHTLNNLLPPLSAASQHYNLRQRRHNLELPNKTVHLAHNNFIQRMLYLDSYLH